jgi:lipopolysaccharide export LptBFGC system permease protein LptF
MMRVQQATIGSILYFISLNIAPAFFENLPLASWLATCMIIKEMQQQNEWEIITILNIPFKKILKILLYGGAFLATISFFGKEFVSHNISQRAEMFKQKEFKQKHNNKIFNQWFWLKENIFCNFQYLNLQTQTGNEISIIHLSPQSIITKLISAKNFNINRKTKEIIIKSGTITKIGRQKNISNRHFFMPSFFSQLNITGQTPPLTRLTNLLVFERYSLPSNVYQNLLYTFLQRVLIHLLLILYPLLTIMFFFFTNRTYRWALILLPYPLFIILSLVADSLMQILHNGSLAFIPYVTLFFLLFTLKKLASSAITL